MPIQELLYLILSLIMVKVTFFLIYSIILKKYISKTKIKLKVDPQRKRPPKIRES